MNRMRGESSNIVVQNTWNSFFNKMDLNNPITIRIGINGEEGILTYKKEETGVSLANEINSVNALGVMTNIPSYHLKMQYEQGAYEEEADYVFAAGAEQTQLIKEVTCTLNGEKTSKRSIGSMIYLSSMNIKNDLEMNVIVEMISKADLSNNKGMLIDMLRQIDSEIDDIMVLSVGGVVQPYIKKGSFSIPLRYSGDGMVKFFGIILRILSEPGCVLLIDEAENGLHYTMHKKMWETIAETAKANNSQIIATTHSYECIKAAFDGVKETGREEDFCYVRLEKDNGLDRAQIYSADELSDAIEIELEVR